MFTIHRIRIENFRRIRYLDISLSHATLFIGPNNSGKTTLLNAVELAFSPDACFLSESDFQKNPDPKAPDPYLPAAVTVRIVPCGESGRPSPAFEDEDAYLKENACRDENGEYFAFRTTAEFSGGKIVLKRVQTRSWKAPCQELAPLGEAFIRNFPVISLGQYCGAGDELDQDKGRLRAFMESFTEPLPEATHQALSSLLDYLAGTLAGAQGAFGQDIAFDEEHLAKLFDRTLRDEATRLLSPGSRRIICLMGVISALALLRARSQSGSAKSFPVVIIDEPELHMHPNAQRAIVQTVSKLSGLLAMTTYSPFVASSVDPRSYRTIQTEGSQMRIRWLPKRMRPDELGSIRRLILRHRSEMLFARAIIFAEGITEEQLFEGLFRRYFGVSPSLLGISIIGVGGKSYEPFIRLATALQKPFCIVSDNDGNTSEVLNRQVSCATREQGLSEDSSGVFLLSRGCSIEHELVLKLNLREEIADTLLELNLNGRSGESGQAQEAREHFMHLSSQALISKLSKKKAEYSFILGEIIARNPYGKSVEESIPLACRKAFAKISRWLGIEPKDAPRANKNKVPDIPQQTNL